MFSKKESTDILPVGTRDVRCVRQQRSRRKELILCQSSIVQVCSDIVFCSCIVCVVTATGARRRKVFLFVRTPGRDAKFCSSKEFFAAIALVHNLKELFGVADDHGSAVAFVSVTGIGCPFSSWCLLSAVVLPGRFSSVNLECS